MQTNMVPVPEAERKGFKFPPPIDDRFFLGDELVEKSWAQGAEYHKALGQELAKRMREYGGPAEQDEPPPGGTPVAMRMAA